MTDETTREEHDLLGTRLVPDSVYYGVHTLRALENFPISGSPISHNPSLVVGMAMVKKAAAQANGELGLLDPHKQAAIEVACDELIAGALHDQFVVDVIQGGAGTSTNMNANEVIANRALEILGHRRGDYTYLHPLEHVNLSQSTNDAYPTALRVALYLSIDSLLDSLANLVDAFDHKALEFRNIHKMGRTQLQDAVPMSLGQEFNSFALMASADILRLEEARQLLCEVNLGGTAIGTGINTDRRYSHLVVSRLAEISGIPVIAAPSLVEATQDVGSLLQVSSVLKRIATRLSKVANDLRLLSSGPRAGMMDLTLPAVQAGSSIMPGKVNPVIPEVINQIAFEVIGNDVTITIAAEAGQLQLNAFEPIMAHSLFKSILHLRTGCDVFAERCIRGIEANEIHLLNSVTSSIGLVTALSPLIGYEQATSVAQEAMATDRSVIDVVTERELLSPEDLARALDIAAMTEPGDSHTPFGY